MTSQFSHLSESQAGAENVTSSYHCFTQIEPLKMALVRLKHTLPLGWSDGCRNIIVMCITIISPFRKFCSHLNEKKIEPLSLLVNDRGVERKQRKYVPDPVFLQPRSGFPTAPIRFSYSPDPMSTAPILKNLEVSTWPIRVLQSRSN